MNYLVSTDLDGTLLDHHTYEWQAAIPAIQLLQERDIPIVFNTSKTLAEASVLQASMGIEAPLIVENGSALAVPRSRSKNYPISDQTIPVTTDGEFDVYCFGSERSKILSFIEAQRETHGSILEGFNDWSTEQIANRTGLSIEAAARSNTKQYSEPFIWLGSDDQLKQFKSRAHALNMNVTQGGRFYHLLGNTSKAIPLLWMKDRFREIDTHIKLICLGDNKNDISMLDIADHPVCVRTPTDDYPELSTQKKVICTIAYGPTGWCEAIFEILKPQPQ